jgi:hypothetical protein
VICSSSQHISQIQLKKVLYYEKRNKIWYDKEGDYLEVLFEKKAGYFKETENDAVMEKLIQREMLLVFLS